MVDEAYALLYTRTSDMEDYEKAYNLLKKAMDIKNELFNGKMPLKDHMYVYLGALLNCSYLNKDYEAIDLGEQSLCIYDFQKVSDLAAKENEQFNVMVYKQIGNLFLNLAQSYRTVHYHHEALDCYKKALLTQDLTKERKATIATLIHNAGRMYYNLGKYKKAANCFEKAAEILRCLIEQKGNMKRLWGHNTLYLSKAYKNLEMFEEAIEVLEEMGNPHDYDSALQIDLLTVTSICQVRIFNLLGASSNAIEQAEQVQIEDDDYCCMLCSPVFIHKFRVRLELINREKMKSDVWESEVAPIIPFDVEIDQHVSKLRKAFLMSHDHDDLCVLLENLADYLQYYKTKEHYQSCQEDQDLLKSVEPNYKEFINSSQICNFFQMKKQILVK